MDYITHIAVNCAVFHIYILYFLTLFVCIVQNYYEESKRELESILVEKTPDFSKVFKNIIEKELMDSACFSVGFPCQMQLSFV